MYQQLPVAPPSKHSAWSARARICPNVGPQVRVFAQPSVEGLPPRGMLPTNLTPVRIPVTDDLRIDIKCSSGVIPSVHFVGPVEPRPLLSPWLTLGTATEGCHYVQIAPGVRESETYVLIALTQSDIPTAKGSCDVWVRDNSIPLIYGASMTLVGGGCCSVLCVVCSTGQPWSVVCAALDNVDGRNALSPKHPGLKFLRSICERHSTSPAAPLRSTAPRRGFAVIDGTPERCSLRLRRSTQDIIQSEERSSILILTRSTTSVFESRNRAWVPHRSLTHPKADPATCYVGEAFLPLFSPFPLEVCTQRVEEALSTAPLQAESSSNATDYSSALAERIPIVFLPAGEHPEIYNSARGMLLHGIVILATQVPREDIFDVVSAGTELMTPCSARLLMTGPGVYRVLPGSYSAWHPGLLPGDVADLDAMLHRALTCGQEGAPPSYTHMQSGDTLVMTPIGAYLASQLPFLFRTTIPKDVENVVAQLECALTAGDVYYLAKELQESLAVYLSNTLRALSATWTQEGFVDAERRVQLCSTLRERLTVLKPLERCRYRVLQPAPNASAHRRSYPVRHVLVTLRPENLNSIPSAQCVEPCLYIAGALTATLLKARQPASFLFNPSGLPFVLVPLSISIDAAGYGREYSSLVSKLHAHFEHTSQNGRIKDTSLVPCSVRARICCLRVAAHTLDIFSDCRHNDTPAVETNAAVIRWAAAIAAHASRDPEDVLFTFFRDDHLIPSKKPRIAADILVAHFLSFLRIAAAAHGRPPYFVRHAACSFLTTLVTDSLLRTPLDISTLETDLSSVLTESLHSVYVHIERNINRNCEDIGVGVLKLGELVGLAGLCSAKYAVNYILEARLDAALTKRALPSHIMATSLLDSHLVTD